MPTFARLFGDAIASLAGVAAALKELERDERWVTWNLGGAAEGRPQFKGPGVLTAREFAELADRLLGRLVKVRESFEHREEHEARRAERRRARAGERREETS